ncbi:gamma-glutamylcyclotransferase [Chthonobacter albigriseus]|uniref:gamma-glutamylcyclotransferase n=1 Tax=Chthonobacter albigriseus TaxID=1683161 RepID=UPI0024558D53|nr:gamma-glutamylcyclotransferase [Chthonobacter albigriseus]
MAFWVFGYGSLMWNPGFPHLRSLQGLLRGAHRSLCVYSYVHRGTPERPGLVFGLDRGGSCRGLAFEVAPADRDAVIAYLREREQVTSVYIEAVRPVRLLTGETVEALTYMVDRSHPQYAGRLDHAEQVRLVRNGVGRSGANPDYVRSTAAHLRELGISDHRVQALVRELAIPEA